MAFASPGELEDRYGLGLSDTRARRLLDDATDEIRSYVGRHLSVVPDDEVTLPGTWSTRLRLPNAPLTAAPSAVTLDGTALMVDADYEWQRGGVLIRPSGWGGADIEIVVTYSHGLDPIPGQVRSACLKLAAASASLTPGVSQESIDGYSVSYAQGSGVLTDMELRILNQLRGRTRAVPMNGGR